MATAGEATVPGSPAEADLRGSPSRVALAAVVGLVAFGGLVRFAATSPLWLDEALSVNLAGLPLGDLPDALRHDGHPALYYVLLGGWMELFGEGDAAVRALSGIASLATVPAVWAAARLRFGPRVAFHAAVLAVTSPFLIRYGSESRMYAVVALVAAIGWWAIERARIEPDRVRLTLVAILSAVAVHTHYWMIWLVATVFVLASAEGRWGRPEARPAATRIAAAVAAGAASFVVWLPVFADQVVHTGTPWADRARPAEVAVETVEALGGGMRFEPVLLGIVLVGLAVLGSLAVESSPGRIELGTRPPHSSLGLVLVVVFTLGSGGLTAIVTGGGFEARYVAVVVPLVIGLVARGTSHLGPRGGLAWLVLVAAFGLAVAVDDARRDRTQGEDVAEIIDATATPGDLVAFCPDQLAPATLRSLDHAGPRITYPETDDPRFVDWYDYSDRIERVDPSDFAGDIHEGAGDRAIWLVMMTSYRGFDDRCETIASILGAARSQQTPLVGSTAFEPMFLHHFGPPG